MSSLLDRDLHEFDRHDADSSGRVSPTVNLDPFPLVSESVAIPIGCVIAGVADPVVTAGCAIVCLVVAGAYRRRLTLSALDVAPRITVAAVAGVLLASASVGSAGLRQLLVAVGIVCVAALLGRFVGYAVERRLRRSGLLGRRTAVVGSGAVASMLTQRMLAEPECGLRPVAVLETAAQSSPCDSIEVPVHPLDEGLCRVLESERIETAIIAFPEVDAMRLLEMVWECDRLDCEIFVVPRLWEVSAVSGNMERVGAIPLARLGGTAHRSLGWYLKLFGDRCFAAAALVALSPLLALIAGAVYFSDRSAPVLFRQKRIGLDGRAFELLKFRSLRPVSEHEEQTTWTVSGDPRLGTFGRILRASSLDELPQLWNVLRGDMALVGPRPERPHFVDKFSTSVPGYQGRHRVPVGLTGWAAINGLRGDTSIAERSRYDNFYIANWSLWLDLKILIRTGWAVVVNFQRDRSASRSSRRGEVICLRPSPL